MKSKISNILKRVILKKGKNQSGAAAVEFALLLPLLVAIVFGISQFGIAFNNWIVINNAAREGARLASVGLFTKEKVLAYAPPGFIIDATKSNGTGKGNPVTVIVTGKAVDLNIPFVHDWGNITLTGTATMRLEK